MTEQPDREDPRSDLEQIVGVGGTAGGVKTQDADAQ
jgi:hypothetical protein